VSAASTRPPKNVAAVELETDSELIGRYLEDAARYPGGHAPAVARPQSADEVASILRRAARVLPVGAQSSLTGGATPSGDVILSTERLADIHFCGDRVVVGAGVTLHTLQDALVAHNAWFPPVPTFLGATVGGAISTNAAGAATFKYGSTREWVEALTIVLPQGDILEIARGEVRASEAGRFVIRTSAGETPIDIPRLQMPDVPKRSAGYYAAPDMDLIDLFIGAEGTLGVIVEATLRVQQRPAGLCCTLITLASEDRAIALTRDLRRAARAAWTGAGRGVDVAAIEHIDRRSLEIVRQDGIDRRLGIALPVGTDTALLVQVELGAEDMVRDLWRDVEDAAHSSSGGTAMGRLCHLMDQHGVLDSAEIALPGNQRRAEAFAELREAVPGSVNRRVSLAHARDSRIHKTAGDMIVPHDRFGDMMQTCRRLFVAADLDLAVWGHISDGNVHPNVIPWTFGDVERGREVLLELAQTVIEMGGCPLAEHGVGRNPVKQQMLRMLYGDEGVSAMRRVKTALDPEWKLAAGVILGP